MPVAPKYVTEAEKKEAMRLKNLRWRTKHPEAHKACFRRWAKDGNPNHYRTRHFKYRYGVTAEDVDLMKAAQAHRCGLCGEVADKLVVDHDHKTGAVRDLLCHKCNRGLGQFEDSVALLTRAIAYVVRHKRH